MNSLEKFMEENKRDERINIIAQNGNDGYHYNLDGELEEPKKSVAKDRKGMPVYSGVLAYFPDALKEVAKCSLAGNNQHHPEKPLHWDKSKSFDNEDALVRHLIDHSKNPLDDDGVLHLTKVAWRALASLQIYLEKNKQIMEEHFTNHLLQRISELEKFNTDLTNRNLIHKEQIEILKREIRYLNNNKAY